MTLALWLLAYLFISYGIGKLYETTLGWKTVTYIFYPGVLVAAGGRLLAALLGGQKAGSLDLMRTKGPSSGGSDSVAGGWWFRFLYAILPFAACVIAFVLIWEALGQPMGFSERLPGLGFEAAAFSKGFGALGDFLSEIVGSFGDQRLGDWRMWLFLYVGFSLIVTSAPCQSDLISVGAVCAGVGLIVLILGQAGVKVVSNGVYGGTFWQGFSFLVAMALFLIVLTVAVLLPMKFIRSSKES
jgi:hypothetical protein